MTTVAELEALVASMPKSRTDDINVAAALEAIDPDKVRTNLQKALRKAKANEARAVKDRDAARADADAFRSEVIALRIRVAERPKVLVDPRVAAAEKRAAEAEKRAERAAMSVQNERSRADAAEGRLRDVRAQAADDIDHANRNATAAEKHVADAEATAKDALDRAEKAHDEGYKEAMAATDSVFQYAERRIREAMRIEEVRDQ